jgi:hypothetical protein
LKTIYGFRKLESMEKRKAHYALPAVKAMVTRLGIGMFTATAWQGLDRMGLSPADR